jgi:hypothetical protein
VPAGAGWATRIGHRLMHCFARIAVQYLVGETAVVGAPTATGRALFALSALFNNDRQRQPHQRPNVGGQATIAAGDENHFVFAGEMRHHLRHTAVLGTGERFQPFEQLDLADRVERRQWIVRHVEGAPHAALLQSRYALLLASGGNRPHGCGRVTEGWRADVVRIGKSGLLASNGAHANPFVDTETAGFDNSLLETPALGAAVLEVEVGVVDLVRHDLAKDLVQVGDVETVGGEQGFLSLHEKRGLFGVHRVSVDVKVAYATHEPPFSPLREKGRGKRGRS